MDILSQGVVGGIIVVLYFIVKDILGPIVKYLMRKLGLEPPRQTAPGDVHLSPTDESRVRVLEVNLTALTAQVVAFDALLTQTAKSLDDKIDTMSESLDNKIDIVLAELKEMREEQAETARILTERIARAETHIEHLLQTRRLAGH